ncbi:MAG: hypothetical protein ACE5I1_13720 [bacterium]
MEALVVTRIKVAPMSIFDNGKITHKNKINGKLLEGASQHVDGLAHGEKNLVDLHELEAEPLLEAGALILQKDFELQKRQEKAAKVEKVRALMRDLGLKLSDMEEKKEVAEKAK